MRITELVARALVEVAIRPRPELVLGGETRLLDLLFAGPRPVAEAVLLLIDRWYRSGDEPAEGPGSLWHAPLEPQLSGGIPSRGSLLAALQRGTRARPDLAAPWRLVCHAGHAVKRGAALSRMIVSPVPESLPPTDGLREAEQAPPPERAGQALL